MDKDKKREDYISWDEYFMGVAKLSALRSKDPNTQVGCCIVSKDNRILSVGYNGAPNGYHDDKFPWGRVGNRLNTKYMYVCHSELNAILNYRGNNGDFVAFDIFVLSSEDGAVYLSNNSDVVAKENTCASNAVRVAFLYQGVSDDSDEVIGLKGASSYNEESQDTNVIWEPNNEDNMSYYAINQNINSSENVEYKSDNDAFTLITPSIQTPESNSVNGSSKTLFNLRKGINKIRIYAWIEGQDKDCYNNITASDIMYNIQISKEA